MRDKRRSLPDERSLRCHLSTLLLHEQGLERAFTCWWFYLLYVSVIVRHRCNLTAI